MILLSSYFCDSYWLNSSREARAGNSIIGMQKKYLSASWRRKGGDRSSRGAGLSKQIQGSVKRKGREGGERHWKMWSAGWKGTEQNEQENRKRGEAEQLKTAEKVLGKMYCV